MSDIKVIKANATLNGRNKRRTPIQKVEALFLCRKLACILSKTKKNGFTSMGKHIYTPNVLYR